MKYPSVLSQYPVSAGIDKVEYNSMAGPQEAGYRHYHAGERVNGRAMEEWLKYSVSLTEFRSNG